MHCDVHKCQATAFDSLSVCVGGGGESKEADCVEAHLAGTHPLLRHTLLTGSSTLVLPEELAWKAMRIPNGTQDR